MTVEVTQEEVIRTACQFFYQARDAFAAPSAIVVEQHNAVLVQARAYPVEHVLGRLIGINVDMTEREAAVLYLVSSIFRENSLKDFNTVEHVQLLHQR